MSTKCDNSSQSFRPIVNSECSLGSMCPVLWSFALSVPCTRLVYTRQRK